MNTAQNRDVQQLTEAVRALRERVEQQEAELRGLRSQHVQAQGAPHPTASRVSRATLLKTIGVGAAAATIAGMELGGPSGNAFASNGNGVAAGRITKAEGGTMVTYDGPSGFSNAVLAGNDSTYGNEGPFNYPAAVVGLAGAGISAGAGGLKNGVHGFTDNGAGSGVIGVNTNLVDGAGNGVLGIASRAGSNGVQGTNSAGTGILGVASSPDNDASGVFGHHTGVTGGIGVFGTQDGVGFGGQFISSKGTGAVVHGGSYGMYAETKSVLNGAYGVMGEISSKTPGGSSAGVLGQNDGTASNGAGVMGTHAGQGVGGLFLSSGGTGLLANGGVGTTGTGASVAGAFGLKAVATEQAVYGLCDNAGDNASAIQGELSSTASGIGSAAVYGQNDATNNRGMGVKGSHAGGGSGGSFLSVSGHGVEGISKSGRGVVASGETAQLKLVPSTANTHPVSGQAGDLFLDSFHRLWLCKGQKNWKLLG